MARMNRRRPLAWIVLLAMVAAVGTVSAGSADAAPVPITPDSGVWQTDGRVDALTYSTDGSTLYLGGLFHHLCPPAQAVCNS